MYRKRLGEIQEMLACGYWDSTNGSIALSHQALVKVTAKGGTVIHEFKAVQSWGALLWWVNQSRVFFLNRKFQLQTKVERMCLNLPVNLASTVISRAILFPLYLYPFAPISDLEADHSCHLFHPYFRRAPFLSITDTIITPPPN